MDSKVTSKGQMTLPKAIREHLNLKSGDRVKLFIDSDGKVFLLPTVPVTALRGMLKTRKHATIDEMHKAVASGVAARFRRSAK